MSALTRAALALTLAGFAAGCARTVAAIDCGLEGDEFKRADCKASHRAARERAKERDRDARSCDRGVAQACYDVAVYDGPRSSDPGSSLRRYERACKAAIADACFRAADYWEHGRGTRADPLRATKLLDRACGLAHGAACARQAELSRDVGERTAWDERACQHKQWTNCLRAARLFATGGDGQLLPDLPRARALMARACRGGHTESCQALGALEVASTDGGVP